MANNHASGQSMAQQYAQMMNQLASPYPFPSSFMQSLQPPPTEEPGTTLLVIGDYIVRRRADKKLWLMRGAETPLARVPVCSWENEPSRALLAASIRWDRRRRPHYNARDPLDGSLLGVRFFSLMGDYHLMSPIQKTVWESSILHAANWDEGEAVRGTCGIHAAWPTRGGFVRPEIDAKVENGLCARVRGRGRFVLGKEGWRSETCVIDTLYLPPELSNRWRVRKRIEKLYPDITLEEETWTLERSLKSAKSLPNTSR